MQKITSPVWGHRGPWCGLRRQEVIRPYQRVDSSSPRMPQSVGESCIHSRLRHHIVVSHTLYTHTASHIPGWMRLCTIHNVHARPGANTLNLSLPPINPPILFTLSAAQKLLFDIFKQRNFYVRSLHLCKFDCASIFNRVKIMRIYNFLQV